MLAGACPPPRWAAWRPDSLRAPPRRGKRSASTCRQRHAPDGRRTCAIAVRWFVGLRPLKKLARQTGDKPPPYVPPVVQTRRSQAPSALPPARSAARRFRIRLAPYADAIVAPDFYSGGSSMNQHFQHNRCVSHVGRRGLLVRRQARPLARVTLRLAHPLPQRLRRTARASRPPTSSLPTPSRGCRRTLSASERRAHEAPA